MKKRVLAIVLLAAVLFAFTGCGQKQEAAAPAEEAQETQEGGQEQIDGMANPWTDCESAEAAAVVADIEPLIIGDFDVEMEVVDENIYRAMDSLEETIVGFAAVQMTVRKGTGFEDGDCSGDVNEYANEWTQDVNGIEVRCFGNDADRASKSIWTVGDYCYSIVVIGLGGDDNYGFSADQLASVVSAVK